MSDKTHITIGKLEANYEQIDKRLIEVITEIKSLKADVKTINERVVSESSRISVLHERLEHLEGLCKKTKEDVDNIKTVMKDSITWGIMGKLIINSTRFFGGLATIGAILGLTVSILDKVFK